MSSIRRKRVWLPLLSVVVAGALAVPTPTLTSAQYVTDPHHLQTAFTEAAAEFGVPQSVLMSVAYNQSRWDHHGEHPSVAGGYGIMHLTDLEGEAAADLIGHSKGDVEEIDRTAADDPTLHTLDTAAELLGVDEDVLKSDPEQNIRGGAALLAEYAYETLGYLPENPADWYGAVAKYSGSEYADIAFDFADEVYATVQRGESRQTADGQQVALAAANVTPNKSTSDSLHLRNADQTGADCPNGLACRFIPAAYTQYSASPTDYGNYDLANRPDDGLDIKYIIIHDVEGSYNSAIKTFQSKSYVSAHYVIRSSDGQITEMLRPENVGWHGGNWYFNTHSIGIEHEGVAVEGATWYTEQMLRSSAKLVKYLAERYDIPLDRQHIIGHDDIPGLTPTNQRGMHWDPGAYFDWKHYFDLLGAPFNPSDADQDSNIVTIAPNYHTNTPVLSYTGGRLLEPQSASFVYLRQAPSADAPLISDKALQPSGTPGTTAINDWGNKASTGQSFVQADQQGDWTAIYVGGQKAWFHNPNGKNTVPGSGTVITPKAGKTSIPVYGAAFPEAAAYAKAGVPARLNTPLQYTIPAGQLYVAGEPVQSSYYYAKLYNQPDTYRVVIGEDVYYQIYFNHRHAFVKASDVDVVTE